MVRRGTRRRSEGTGGNGRESRSPRTERAGRALWSGTLVFGLVSVPVELFSTIRSSRPRLRRLTVDGVPLRRRWLCSHDETFVDSDHLVRGYETEDGRHVVVLDEELEALAPRRSREIDLRRFVPADALDPAAFVRGFLLAPGGESVKAYRLLARVMERSGRAGIATFVLRGKEHLVAILSGGGLLRAETLRFHDELRSPEDVGLPEPREAPRDRVRAATAAIEARLADRLDEDALADRRALGLEALVRRKARRGEDVLESPLEEGAEAEEPAGGDGEDLLESIRRSLRALEESGPDGDLAELTKAELYERAAERDVPGRSSMTKEELLEALRRRS